LSERFGIDLPLFAFTYEPAVAAAVTNAGGLGVLGAVRFSPEELEDALVYVEKETGGRPFGVDIVMPASSAKVEAVDVAELTTKLEAMLPDEHKRFLENLLAQHHVPPALDDGTQSRGVLGWTDVSAAGQLDVIFQHQPVLIANALGPPPDHVVARAHDAGMAVAALCGRVDQARKHVAAGVDIVVAQGTEAGGHTGEVATMVLVPEVVDAIAPTPVLAAGGIGRGRQLAAALALGAQGVWTGSLWLTSAEHPMVSGMRTKLLAATSRDTVRSRSWTGKPARQLRSAWTDAWDGPDSPGPLPMPLQYLLIADAQRRIQQHQPVDLMNMPVGQVVGQATEVRPVAEIVADLAREFEETVGRLDRASARPAEAGT
jgi:NAD(P)H-dependent flavin oxidoreductase YrpB (nitropropane dioxygenase family)